MRSTRSLILALPASVLLAVGLAGCSGGAAESTPTPTRTSPLTIPTSSAPESPAPEEGAPAAGAPGAYGTADDLLAAYQAAGRECPEPMRNEDFAFDGQSISCGPDALAVLSSPEEREAAVTAMTDEAASQGIAVTLVVGDTWYVSSPDAEALAPQLGGEYVSA